MDDIKKEEAPEVKLEENQDSSFDRKRRIIEPFSDLSVP
jgi:hypothetical protein